MLTQKGGIAMIRKIADSINTVSKAAKLSIVLGCLTGTALILIAAALLSKTGASLYFDFLCESMAKTAVTLFAEGVFFGLLGDFLLAVVDRGKK